MINHKLKILYIGSSSANHQENHLISNQLAEYDVSFVTKYTDFSHLVTELQPDLILADYTRDAFYAGNPESLKGFPFPLPLVLIVPEALEDEVIALLDHGVDDYVLANNVRRLQKAISNLAAKSRLQRSGEQRYRYLFDQNLSGFYTSSVSGLLVDCNQAFATMLGYATPDELIGNSVVDLYQVSSDRQDFLDDLLKHKKLSNYQSTLMRKDGNIIHLLENIYLFNDPLTGEDLCQGVMIDISEYIMAKEDVARARALLSEAQRLAKMGNWNYNMRKQELTLSSGMRDILGVPHKKYIAVDELKTYIHPDDVEGIIQGILALPGKAKKAEKSFRICRPDGRTIKATSVNTFDYDDNGRVLRFYGVVQDRSDLLAAEEARDQITTELISRNKTLEQFTYVISHNLRAPVANIRALIEILELDLEGKSKDLIDKMSDSVHNLDTVITDLNQILQTKQLQNAVREHIQFEDLMRSIRLSIKNLIEAEDVIFEHDFVQAPAMVGIRGYLYSILYNLTLNSVKYRRADASPLIRIAAVQAEKQITLTFQDNGKGIDLSKNGDQLFGLYKRFDTTIDGKGMGLYMVKTQVEELGGTITASSTLGQGTTFIMQFPGI
ncbi:MAG: PAS domain-containing sensor histidine kinase [Pedobacter sp.]|nr:MAG: PAS domain-containing sensor histidine kinase [Pedobacter sp.]